MQRIKRSTHNTTPWLLIRDKVSFKSALCITSALDYSGSYNQYSILRERMFAQIEGADAPYWYVTNLQIDYF